MLFTLGMQRQEEMKSLIQNSLKLGEKPQTTEASMIKKYEYRKRFQRKDTMKSLFLFFLMYIIHDFT